MPRRCCVPMCKSNYDSTLKENNTCVTTFGFPQDAVLKAKWIQAVHRKDFSPTSNSAVCSKHFLESDIIRHDKYLNSDGSITPILLKKPRLKEGAIPSQFPGLPSYLSKSPSHQRRNPESRRQQMYKAHSEKIENFLRTDFIKDFNDIVSNYKTQVNLFSWDVKCSVDCLYFFIINTRGPIEVTSSIVVTKELHIKVYVGKNELTSSDLRWVLPVELQLSRWSQLANLLSRYKTNESCNNVTCVKNLISTSFQFLKQASELIDEGAEFAFSKQLEIIKDQLNAIISTKRKYCSSTIVMAFMLHSQSPSCYNLLRDYFMLPHKRYLQYLSSSFNVSPDSESNNSNYLLNITKNLNPTQKVVSLLIDEIYISPCYNFRSNHITGIAANDNETAKTILAFMVSSPLSSFKEMVKLVPVHNVKGEQLKQMASDVIHFVQQCGLIIISVIADNHSINRIMFAQFSSILMYKMVNPRCDDLLVFFLFDVVHIFKNIWKNWLNLKNLHQTFVFVNFEGNNQLLYAKFQDIKDLYEAEKHLTVKQAYKLCYKSLYPTVLEKQKVHLADNVFHRSTISALKADSRYKDTAVFVEIIRRWWDIVSNVNTLKGKIQKNDWCVPFTDENDSRLEFLKKFVIWIDAWHNLTEYNGHLTKETYNALRQSTVVLIELIPYCFKKYSPKYILPGKFTTEHLEKRFGMYRLLSGCNYNVSIADVVGAEKKIRVKHIFQTIGPNFKPSTIREFDASVSNSDFSFQLNEQIGNDNLSQFLFIISSNDYFKNAEIDLSSKIYVCGYAAHAVTKKLDCIVCKSLIVEDKGASVDNTYFDSLQRGGLSIATARVNFVFVHMYSILHYIINDPDLDIKFLRISNQKDVLCGLTLMSIKADFFYADFLEICSCGQSFTRILHMLCSVLSNLMLNNYTKNKNEITIALNKSKHKKSDDCGQNSVQLKKLKTFN